MQRNLVTVSNTLVQASYNISLVEKRLLLMFISTIDNKKGNLPVLNPTTPYIIRVQDYADLYGIRYETAKDELSRAVDRLFQQEVTYQQDENTVVTSRWISSKIQYIKDDHLLALKWASDIIPLISELRRNFTSYRLQFLKTLPSVYSIRLYEIFGMELSKSRKSSIKLTLQVDTIRNMLALGDKYKSFADFMRRVVEEPIDYINKDDNASIKIRIEDENGKRLYIKRGKRVTAITFIISRKK